jgi:hypothetical protein
MPDARVVYGTYVQQADKGLASPDKEGGDEIDDSDLHQVGDHEGSAMKGGHAVTFPLDTHHYERVLIDQVHHFLPAPAAAPAKSAHPAVRRK